jgi:hypothetical protein
MMQASSAQVPGGGVEVHCTRLHCACSSKVISTKESCSKSRVIVFVMNTEFTGDFIDVGPGIGQFGKGNYKMSSHARNREILRQYPIQKDKYIAVFWKK